MQGLQENRELGALTNNNPVLYTQRSSKELVLVCHAQGFQPRMLRLVSILLVWVQLVQRRCWCSQYNFQRVRLGYCG